MIRLCLALCLLLVSGTSSASLLWKISKNGISHHVFGTIHISDADIIALPPAVERIVSGSSRLVVEAVSEDVNEQAIATRTLLKSATLRSVLGSELYDEVTRVAQSRGMSPAGLIHLKPWAVGLMLNVPISTKEPVLDVYLQQRFLGGGRSVFALETIDEQLDLFDQLPQADQIEFLKASLSQQEEFDAMFSTMKSLYLAGDLDALQAFSRQQTDKANSASVQRLMERILDERNQRMFARVQPYLRQSGTLIAVGALHLPGQQGLLTLFKQAGWTVTAVTP